MIRGVRFDFCGISARAIIVERTLIRKRESMRSI